MSLEQSLGSTTSLATGAVNPVAAGDNFLWPLILEGMKASWQTAVQLHCEGAARIRCSHLMEAVCPQNSQGAEDEKADKKKGDDKSRQPLGERAVAAAERATTFEPLLTSSFPSHLQNNTPELFLHVCGGKETGKTSLIRHLLDIRVRACAKNVIACALLGTSPPSDGSPKRRTCLLSRTSRAPRAPGATWWSTTVASMPSRGPRICRATSRRATCSIAGSTQATRKRGMP